MSAAPTQSPIAADDMTVPQGRKRRIFLMPVSLTRRLLVLATLGALPVLGLAGAMLLWLFTNHIEQQFDTYLAAYQQELVAQITVDEHARLQVPAQPLDPRFNLPFSGWYWQIIANGKIAAQSRSLDPAAIGGKEMLFPLDNDARELKAGDAIGPGGVAIRVLQEDIRLPGNMPPLHVTVSGPRSEITRQTNTFGLHLALILAALGLAFLVAMSLQIRFGLQPLRRLQGELQQIRSGVSFHLSRGYPEEVAPLADELNAVLDHNSALIERARMQAGNLAHALKTPLSVIRHELSSLEAGRETPTAVNLQDQLEIMARQIDRTLARIRLVGPDKAAGRRCNVGDIVQDLIFSMRLLHHERALRLELVMPVALEFLGDQEDLTEILGNLIDNACKWATGHVRVAALLHIGGAGQRIRLLIEDDGPGIPTEQRSLALIRGLRLDETKSGSGLGLDIVCETAELYGGSLKLGESSLGGLAAELLLPGCAAQDRVN
jgi:signal transduction histidine kinase